MRSENEVRNKASEYLETVINHRDDLDDFDYAKTHLRLDALLWVLEEFDGLSVKK